MNSGSAGTYETVRTHSQHVSVPPRIALIMFISDKNEFDFNCSFVAFPQLV